MRQQQFLVGDQTFTLIWSEEFGEPKQIASVRLNDGRLVLDFGKNALVTITVQSGGFNIHCHVWQVGTLIIKDQHDKILVFEETTPHFHHPKLDQLVHPRFGRIN